MVMGGQQQMEPAAVPAEGWARRESATWQHVCKVRGGLEPRVSVASAAESGRLKREPSRLSSTTMVESRSSMTAAVVERDSEELSLEHIVKERCPPPLALRPRGRAFGGLAVDGIV